MASTHTKKKTVGKDEWEQRLSKVVVEKQALNRLIMDYLVVEGYMEAAKEFSQESGLSPCVDLLSIQDRREIRQAVQSGDIDTAIDLVNDLNPEILDTNPQLYFHLQQQRLIELIRLGDDEGALAFAADEMAPRGEEHPEFLQELERTMALLAFRDMQQSPVQDLLDPQQRLKTAQELNAAILTSQSREPLPKLPHLLKVLDWSQEQLDQRMVYPRINDFVKADLVTTQQEGSDLQRQESEMTDRSGL
ncbi:CTLH/CRA C-terminal to lish motif domain-containing protein [Chlamydoabsidia padenii]|nr:CTLH/CRA C-terminal to lish motif domain-containing protein [Chlamydoabsidia padenii]